MSLRVLEPGLASWIVDAGRPHHRALGVPVGGAADRASFALGNVLIGNAPDAAALEVALVGPRLVAEGDVAGVVYGAPFAPTVAGVPHEVGATFQMRCGDELRIGGTPSGARAYLCVRGGLQGPVVLGSRSGLRPIRVSDVLPCSPSMPNTHRRLAVDAEEVNVLRCMPGLQADWFDAEEFAQEFTVGSASNRMGLRLDGTPLTVPPRELASEPIAPGTVQVTREGQCIVLGVEGQTIGGYPKIAHVIRADLDRLGRLRPGGRVRFRWVTLAQARDLGRAADAALRARLVRLRLSLDA